MNIHHLGPISFCLVFCTVCSSFFTACASSLSEVKPGPSPEEDGITAQVWLSEPSNGVWLERKTDLFSSDYSGKPDVSIVINPLQTFQTMAGFGASLTESSAFLFETQLSDSVYTEVIESLFGQTGIGINLLRQPMGSTDFSLDPWTYDDIPAGEEDFALSHFSLSREDSYIRPALTKIVAVQPGRVSLIASPWSPPAWMKTIEHLNGSFGGRLRTDSYDAYADYFVRFLEGYADRGTPLAAITVQNEPLYAAPYPGMLMDSSEAASFISVLADKLIAVGLSSVKILGYDHNYDDIEYADRLLSSSAAASIDGTAFHYYSAWHHGDLSTLHNQYPEKEIWVTEAGTGNWIAGGKTAGMFMDTMIHLVRFPRNWARSYITWNLALDENGGPCLKDGESSNIGLITIRSDRKDSWSFTNTYYALGHTSKFVSPGAVRIASTTQEGGVETVAYKNPDGSKVVVLVNTLTVAKNVSIKYEGHFFWQRMAAQSAATIVLQ